MSKAVSSALRWKHPLRLLAAIGEDLIWCKASSMDATTSLSLMIGTPARRAANERCTSTTIYRRPEASERKMGDQMGDQKYSGTKKPRKIRALMKNSGGSVEIRTQRNGASLAGSVDFCGLESAFVSVFVPRVFPR